MDINNLGMFIDIAESGSIAKAAQKNYISRQALTELVNKLEQDFEVALFTRGHSGVCLTAEGRYLYHSLLDLRKPWDELIFNIKNMEVLGQGRSVCIGMPMFLFDEEFLLSVMNLDKRFDLSSVIIKEFSTEKCWSLLHDRAIDLAITYYSTDDTTLLSRPISGFSSASFLLASSHSPLASEPSITSSCLSGETIMMVDDVVASNTFRDYAVRANARLKIVPRNHLFIKQMIAAEKGVLIVPAATAFYFINDGSILAKKITDFPRAMQQYVTYPAAADEVTVAIGLEIERIIQRRIKSGCYSTSDKNTIVFSGQRPPN